MNSGDSWDGRRAGRRGLHPVLIVLLVSMAAATASCVGCVIVGQGGSVEGRSYAEKALPAISQPWDSAALVERAAPELLAEVPSEKLASFVSFVGGRLGPLKYPPLFQNGGWRVFYGTKGLVLTTVQFADCDFQKAQGRVTFQLMRRGSRWQIRGFHVNSDALVQ